MITVSYTHLGKALILFTAKSDMQEVYEKLKEAVPYKVLVQNAGSSQTDILKEFKRDVNSVLLGTGAYWEGISEMCIRDRYIRKEFM